MRLLRIFTVLFLLGGPATGYLFLRFLGRNTYQLPVHNYRVPVAQWHRFLAERGAQIYIFYHHLSAEKQAILHERTSLSDFSDVQAQVMDIAQTPFEFPMELFDSEGPWMVLVDRDGKIRGIFYPHKPKEFGEAEKALILLREEMEK